MSAADSYSVADFEAIYRAHRDWVVGLAYRFCGDRDEALDVMQEAFLYLWKKLPLRVKATTLLYPVVKHLALDRRRRKRAESLPGELEGARGIPDDMRGLLAPLSEEHREIVMLRFAQGLDLAEIADALGIPLGTVKSRLHYALGELRKKLGDD